MAVVEECGDLLAHQWREAHAEVTDGQHATIRGAFQFGFYHRHGAIVGSIEPGHQSTQSMGLGARDEAELRAKRPISRYAMFQYLAAHRTQQAPRGAKLRQCAGALAAAHRRTHEHHATEIAAEA